MNSNLFKAILSMDSYNRGYNAGIDLRPRNADGTFKLDSSGKPIESDSVNTLNVIGTASVFKNKGDTEAVTAGFYGIAYQLAGGEKVISYRGTDTAPDLSADILKGDFSKFLTPDILNGYAVGAGIPVVKQAELAIKFYQSVAGAESDWRSANISVTGHSLGGGLAGLVGSLYNRTGLLFNNMAYQDAADNAYKYSTGYYKYVLIPNSIEFEKIFIPANTELQKLIYGTGSTVASNYANLNTIYMQDEFLTTNRLLQTGGKIPLNLGYDASSNLSGTQLHSMATMVMQMYANTEIVDRSWEKAAKYFWPVAYNNGFADSIGMNTTLLSGRDRTNGEYAAILRQIIAYSAIDEGERVFGDTAIRAFYNDANDLGRALGASPSPTLQNLADDVSKAFIQYAGQLALSKILEKDNSQAKDGIITLSGDESTLGVSFNEDVWKRAAGGTLPNMVAQQDLFTSISFFASPNNVLKNGILSLMQDLWGTSSSSIFENFIFATKADGGTITIPTINNYVSEPSSKNNLFVGSNQNDIINGSNDNDLIFVGSGEDIVIGNSRNDIFVSGQGNKMFSRGNITYEGLFNSTYPLSPVSITSGYLDFNGTLGGNAFIVDKGALGKDTLISMGSINLTSLNDTVVFDGYTSPARKSIAT